MIIESEKSKSPEHVMQMPLLPAKSCAVSISKRGRHHKHVLMPILSNSSSVINTCDRLYHSLSRPF